VAQCGHTMTATREAHTDLISTWDRLASLRGASVSIMVATTPRIGHPPKHTPASAASTHLPPPPAPSPVLSLVGGLEDSTAAPPPISSSHEHIIRTKEILHYTISTHKEITTETQDNHSPSFVPCRLSPTPHRRPSLVWGGL